MEKFHMKKIFTFLSVLMLSLTVFTACNDDDAKLTYPVDSNGNPIIPTDNDPIVEPAPDQLVLHISSYEIALGSTVEFTSFLNGGNVTDLATYYVNNTPIQGRYYKPAANGTYTVVAKLQGAADSAPKQLIVTGEGPEEPGGPIIDIEPGEGNVVLNGNEYVANYHILDFVGVYYTDETQTDVVAVWESYTIDNNDLSQLTVAAVYRFDTPAEIVNDEGGATFEIPTATNSTLEGIVVAAAGTEQFENVLATGTIKYTSIDEQAGTVAFAANTAFEGNTLVVTFNGNAGIDLSQQNQQNKSAKAVNNKRKFIKINRNEIKNIKTIRPMSLKNLKR